MARRVGDTNAQPIIRLLRRVRVAENGCWEWMGARAGGYGQFAAPDHVHSMRMTHRWFYQHVFGPLPEDIQLDHLCRNRACLRLDHLEPVTPAENIRRGERWGPPQTHCKRGHEYTEANTYRNAHGRSCRECQLQLKRQQYATAKAALTIF